MDVTRSNLKELLPSIEKAISNADFLSIDGEFTGLRAGPDVNSFCTPSEYYQTLLNGSTNFLLVQFGLCAFRWDKESKQFKQCAYNFYLFPRQAVRSAPDKIFLCQSSSIDFLAAQKFDFNKLFYEGISYLSSTEELKMREQLEEKQAYDNASKDVRCAEVRTPIPIPDENKVQIENMCSQVKLFLEESKLDSIQFDNANAFIRKLLYQELETRFKGKIYMETKVCENQKRVVIVSQVKNEKDLAQKHEGMQAKEWEQLEAAIGFSLIAKKISESRKLVIGHCILMDLLHVLNQFFSPLPEDYKEFKEYTNCIFPNILDTMYMASVPPFKESVTVMNLVGLLSTLSEDPFVMPPVESESLPNLLGYKTTENKYHEAGYDAYVTGLCFISMFNYMVGLQHCTLQESPISAESLYIKPFLNKIYLFKTSFQDSPYINLNGKDANPSRDHVFHMTFPKEWKRNDILNVFSVYGGVNLAFINDTSAYVGLRRRDQTGTVLRKLCPLNSTFSLKPYKVFKALANQLSETSTEDDTPDSHQYSMFKMLNLNDKLPKSPARKRKLSGEGRQEVPNETTLQANIKGDLPEPVRQCLGSAPSSGGVDGVSTRGKRRRTPSGVFTVTEEPASLLQETFSESDDWE